MGPGHNQSSHFLFSIPAVPLTIVTAPTSWTHHDASRHTTTLHPDLRAHIRRPASRKHKSKPVPNSPPVRANRVFLHERPSPGHPSIPSINPGHINRIAKFCRCFPLLVDVENGELQRCNTEYYSTATAPTRLIFYFKYGEYSPYPLPGFREYMHRTTTGLA